MAQLVIGAVGAAIGFVASGFNPYGAYAGWAVGSAIGGALAPAQKIKVPPQALMDLRVTGTEYGQAIPWVRGSAQVGGQLWWNTDRRATSTTTSSGGGKGGGRSPRVEQTIVTYDMDMLVGLTNNEILGVARIWKNGELVYDGSSNASQDVFEDSVASNLWTRMTVYTGSDSQLPDPTYEAAVGAANAPAYRGRSYVFIEGLKLGQSGQVPNLTFEVVTSGTIETFQAPAWVAHPGSTPQYQWNRITCGNGRFVCGSLYDIGTNTAHLMTSDDGVTWTEQTIPAMVAHIENIVFALKRFVYVGSAGATVGGVSFDGVHWSATAVPTGGRSFEGIAYGNGLFVTVAVNSSPALGSILTSPDGISWTQRSGIAVVGHGWKDIIYAAGKFVVVGASTTDMVMYSTDGISWTRGSAPAGVWNRVAYGNGVFVAVNSTAAQVMTSPDGITWTMHNSAPINTRTWSGLTFGNGIFVATSNDVGGSSGKTMYSADGVTWTAVNAANGNSWADLAYGNGHFVAVSGGGTNPTMVTQPMVTIDTITADPPSVEEVTSDICLRAGLDASQFDVTALATITRPVKSIAVSQVVPMRQPLELLMAAYFFEMTLSDKLYFKPRGGAPVATIPYLDLGAAEEGAEQPDPLDLKQANELEIPAQVAVTYINIDNDYQSDTQYSDRLISAMDGTVAVVQMALGMTPSEAKSVADVLLLDMSASRVTAPLALLGDYCVLEPTDVLSVTALDGSIFRMRIVKKKDSYPLLEFSVVLDDATVLSSQGITSTDYSSSTTVPTNIDTVMALLDIPILQDTDNDPGFYVAARGSESSGYAGSAIFSSPDDIVYDRQVTIIESAVIGLCMTVLGDWTGGRVFDEKSSVQVYVGDQTLESSTRDALLNNASINAMLVGSEVIQFRDATLVSTGIYTLTGLLRGARGTEWASTGHAFGETCVTLTFAGLRRVPLQISDIGISRYYKGVTLGRTLDSATAEQFTNTAVGLKPFSCFDLRKVLDGSSNATWTWQRRSRLTVRAIGTLGILVPLGEETESYELEVWDSGGAYTTLKRILTASTPTVSYTAAQQTADGYAPGNPIYTRLYQRSDIVGRGYVFQPGAI